MPSAVGARDRSRSAAHVPLDPLHEPRCPVLCASQVVCSCDSTSRLTLPRERAARAERREMVRSAVAARPTASTMAGDERTAGARRARPGRSSWAPRAASRLDDAEARVAEMGRSAVVVAGDARACARGAGESLEGGLSDQAVARCCEAAATFRFCTYVLSRVRFRALRSQSYSGLIGADSAHTVLV